MKPEYESDVFKAIANVAAKYQAQLRLDQRCQEVRGTRPSGNAWFERYFTALECLIAAMCERPMGSDVPQEFVNRAKALVDYVYENSVECQATASAKIYV